MPITRKQRKATATGESKTKPAAPEQRLPPPPGTIEIALTFDNTLTPTSKTPQPISAKPTQTMQTSTKRPRLRRRYRSTKILQSIQHRRIPILDRHIQDQARRPSRQRPTNDRPPRPAISGCAGRAEWGLGTSCWQFCSEPVTRKSLPFHLPANDGCPVSGGRSPRVG